MEKTSILGPSQSICCASLLAPFPSFVCCDECVAFRLYRHSAVVVANVAAAPAPAAPVPLAAPDAANDVAAQRQKYSSVVCAILQTHWCPKKSPSLGLCFRFPFHLVV
uniref:Putative secreted protein n=1 Tax=Anopheles triannulatus TaxID=58253 RepID=A0A2M4B4N0_9DIPT